MQAQTLTPQEKRIYDLVVDLYERLKNNPAQDILTAEICRKHKTSAAIFTVMIHAGLIERIARRRYRWILPIRPSEDMARNLTHSVRI